MVRPKTCSKSPPTAIGESAEPQSGGFFACVAGAACRPLDRSGGQAANGTQSVIPLVATDR